MKAIMLQTDVPTFEITNWWEFWAAIIFILLVYGLKEYYKYRNDKSKNDDNSKANEAQIRLLNKIVEAQSEQTMYQKLLLNGSLNRLSQAGMRIVYESIYQRSSVRVSLYIAECKKSEVIRKANRERVKKLIEKRIDNMFLSDLSEFEQFTYEGHSLDKFIWLEGKDIIIDKCINYIINGQTTEEFQEKLFTEFTSHANITIDKARNLNTN